MQLQLYGKKLWLYRQAIDFQLNEPLPQIDRERSDL